MMNSTFLIRPSREEIQAVMNEIPTATGVVRLTDEDLHSIMDNAQTLFALKVSMAGEQRMENIIKAIEELCRRSTEGYNVFSAKRVLLHIEGSAYSPCMTSEMTLIGDFLTKKLGKDKKVLFGMAESQNTGDALTLRLIMVDFEKNSNE